jgi:M6 family metalloprotease-like protein
MGRQCLKSGVLVGILIVSLLVFGMQLTAYALQKPTPEMIEQYEQDGTLAQRIEDAKMIGNHNLSPKFIYKLYQNQVSTEGGAQPAVMTPPPAWRGMPTMGTVKCLILLIDFADTPHIASDTNAAVTTAINGTPATGFPYESLHNFYNRSSYGQLNIQGTVLGWYTTAYNRSAVVQTPAGRETLIKEALDSFNASGHDFTQYDNDGDGYIDYFAVVWAGGHGAWASFWWGYQTTFSDRSYMLDGKRLGDYSWQWESYNYPTGSFTPGVLIHETGHALGLPDLYDYNNTVGPKGGVGGLDQMDANWGDHNCFSKYVLDWLTPTFLTSGTTNVTLNPSSSNKNCIIAMPGIATNPFQEYFVIQNRDRSGNDTGYPNSGLLIWHVDARLNSYGTNYIYDNSYTDHKLVRLMEADGLEEIEKNIGANAGDYYVPGKFFTPISMPNSKRYNGTSTNLNVTNITAGGSQRSADISFKTTSGVRGVPWLLLLLGY